VARRRSARQPTRDVAHHASRLRTSLGDPATLVGRDGGDVLDLGPDAVDAARFEALVAAVTRGRADPDATERDLAQLDEALALWRGAPLAGFDHEGWARPDAVRLTELRHLALDDRAESHADGRPGRRRPTTPTAARSSTRGP
jgi:hypothetical protein